MPWRHPVDARCWSSPARMTCSMLTQIHPKSLLNMSQILVIPRAVSPCASLQRWWRVCLCVGRLVDQQLLRANAEKSLATPTPQKLTYLPLPWPNTSLEEGTPTHHLKTPSAWSVTSFGQSLGPHLCFCNSFLVHTLPKNQACGIVENHPNLSKTYQELSKPIGPIKNNLKLSKLSKTFKNYHKLSRSHQFDPLLVVPLHCTHL